MLIIKTIIASLLCFSGLVLAEPNIGVFPNKSILNNNEGLQLWVRGSNIGVSKTVDVHLGLISPSGVIYEFPNWNTSLDPWLNSVELKSGFQFPAKLVANVTSLPNSEPGMWQTVAALTEPGTLEIISFSTQPFFTNLGGTPSANDPRVGIVNLLSLKVNDDIDDILVSNGVFWFSADEPNYGNTFSIRFGNSAFHNAPIEGCIFEEPLLDNYNRNDFQIVTLDAGKLSVSSSTMGLYNFFPLLLGSGIGYANLLEDDFGNQESLKIEPSVDYTLSSGGGNDISSFSTTIKSPEKINIINPASAGVVTQSADNDMLLEWSGNGNSPIVVTIIPNKGIGQSAAISCQFIDDGSAVIPSEQLVKMRNYIDNIGNSSFLVITRNSFGLIRTDNNALDYGIFNIGMTDKRELRLR